MLVLVVSDCQVRARTRAQRPRRGMAARKGARGPSWRLSARRWDRRPASIARRPL